MPGTLPGVIGVIVKVPELTEISFMELAIPALIHSSNTGCCLDTKFSARYSTKKEGRHLALEAENPGFSSKMLGDLFPHCLT